MQFTQNIQPYFVMNLQLRNENSDNNSYIQNQD